jgi:predicted subunit of tRNA(5-methylaminomethyl-2-thiouridylate) methyltransferase
MSECIFMNEKFNVKDTMAEMDSANILISYSGFMSDQTLEGVSQGIKAIFESGSMKTRKSRKVFSVFVESAQNIIFYSGKRMEIDGTRDGAGFGSIFIQQMEDNVFDVISVTTVLADKKSDFEGRLTKLMEMTDEDIDAAYEEQLLSQINGSEKGAGLGLFEIRRQTSNLTFDFSPQDDDFLLIMRATI